MPEATAQEVRWIFSGLQFEITACELRLAELRVRQRRVKEKYGVGLARPETIAETTTDRPRRAVSTETRRKLSESATRRWALRKSHAKTVSRL